jgi:hypothetical protein
MAYRGERGWALLRIEGGLANFGDGRVPALHPGAVGLEFLPFRGKTQSAWLKKRK